VQTSDGHYSGKWLRLKILQFPISLHPALFDLTFESLIVADEASLNAKPGARLERHSLTAII
jgi:hypothetical protein